ncbi:MAG: hypothetical protein AMXMBFR84_17990 [Candidatus Hydrogenedentota bacterium]
MIKHLLVPTDGSDRATTAIRYATAVAKQYGAKIHGLHVVDVRLLEGPILRDVSASLGTAPYANYQGNISMILEERGKAALEVVRKACEEQGVPVELHLETGLVVRTIVESATLTDLVILARSGEHSEWLEGVLGSTTSSVVRRSERPVLITGIETPGRNAFLLAYDGSSHARRALQIAADVSRDWSVPLHLLLVGEDHATVWLDEAKSYLDPHGVSFEYTVRNGDPSETIVEHAREIGADLLIMGAFGHSKVREWVVGSTTAYVMNKVHCPVLLTR